MENEKYGNEDTKTKRKRKRWWMIESMTGSGKRRWIFREGRRDGQRKKGMWPKRLLNTPAIP
jgi:hypothetical protein